jgi:hypothetical protein
MQPGREAGRELDAEIAEKVFGCKVKRPFNPAEHPDISQKEYEHRRRWEQSYKCECPGHPHSIDDGDYYGTDIKEYSTDIAAAFEVVNELSKRFHDRINGATDGFLIQQFEQSLSPDRATYHVRLEYESNKYEASAPTLPHAICLAALKALGIQA